MYRGVIIKLFMLVTNDSIIVGEINTEALHPSTRCVCTHNQTGPARAIQRLAPLNFKYTYTSLPPSFNPIATDMGNSSFSTTMDYDEKPGTITARYLFKSTFSGN